MFNRIWHFLGGISKIKKMHPTLGFMEICVDVAILFALNFVDHYMHFAWDQMWTFDGEAPIAIIFESIIFLNMDDIHPHLLQNYFPELHVYYFLTCLNGFKQCKDFLNKVFGIFVFSRRNGYGTFLEHKPLW